MFNQLCAVDLTDRVIMRDVLSILGSYAEMEKPPEQIALCASTSQASRDKAADGVHLARADKTIVPPSRANQQLPGELALAVQAHQSLRQDHQTDARAKARQLSLKVCEQIMHLLIKRCFPKKAAKVGKFQDVLKKAFGSDSDSSLADISSDEGETSIYQPSPGKLGELSTPSGSDVDTDLTKLAKYVEDKEENEE